MNGQVAAIDALERLLPQTQCTQCGYAGCRPYAQAMVIDEAPINRCPPGGAAGIAVLAAHLGRPPLPLDPQTGVERPRRVARIVAHLCIGCTKCIQACPVDAIAGASRRLHAVITEDCTGCDLCLPPCPVDCIEMVVPPAGQEGWSRADADAAYGRHQRRSERLQRDEAAQQRRLADKAQHHLDELDAEMHDAISGTQRSGTSYSSSAEAGASGPDTLARSDAQTARKRAVIEAAMARARARLAGAQ